MADEEVDDGVYFVEMFGSELSETDDRLFFLETIDALARLHIRLTILDGVPSNTINIYQDIIRSVEKIIKQLSDLEKSGHF